MSQKKYNIGHLFRQDTFYTSKKDNKEYSKNRPVVVLDILEGEKFLVVPLYSSKSRFLKRHRKDSDVIVSPDANNGLKRNSIADVECYSIASLKVLTRYKDGNRSIGQEDISYIENALKIYLSND